MFLRTVERSGATGGRLKEAHLDCTGYRHAVTNLSEYLQMSLEWGWLRKASRVDLDNQGIFLQGDGGCTVLLLHGLTGAPLELGYLAYHLRHRGGHSVHVPRLVNHGQPLGVLAR